MVNTRFVPSLLSKSEIEKMPILGIPILSYKLLNIF